MLITSPNEYDKDRILNTIFLAGSISGARDWQQEIVKFIDCEKYDVFNPRRVEGLAQRGEEAEKQIEWEHNLLTLSNNIIFWFDTTISPITLFEYGAMLGYDCKNSRKIIMGRHPDYPRSFDLDIQTKLHNKTFNNDILIANSFEEFTKIVNRNFG